MYCFVKKMIFLKVWKAIIVKINVIIFTAEKHSKKAVVIVVVKKSVKWKHNYKTMKCTPLYVFQYFGHTKQRCLDEFLEVALQEGQTEAPLGSTHCLHCLGVSLPNCSLEPLIQLAYLLQPCLWDNNYRLKISVVAMTAQHFYHLASILGLNWIKFVVPIFRCDSFHTKTLYGSKWDYMIPLPSKFLLVEGEKKTLEKKGVIIIYNKYKYI